MKKLFFFSFLLLSLVNNAQQPSWTASLGTIGLNDIQFIRKSGANTVLISTSNKIYGVSAKDKKIIWESKNFSNLTDSSVKVHAGTPYITINGTSSFGFKKEYTMLNAETGEVIFSNKTESGDVTSEVFLQKKNAFLVFAKEGSGVYASYRSLETGEETWRKNFRNDETKAGGLLGSLLKLAGEFMLRSEVNNDVSESIVLYTANKLFCLDPTNGNELWSKDYGKVIVNAIRSDDSKYLFVQYSGILFNYIDMATGKEMLAKPSKLKFGLINATKLDKGYMILTDRGVNILQEDGSFKFDKPIGKSINTAFAWKLNNGYLLASNPDAMKVDSRTGTQTRFGRLDILKINEEGDKVWAKYLGGSGKMFPLKTGLFVIDEQMANLYNYSDGTSVWDGKIKLKGETSFGYDQDSATIIAYNRGNIERFSLLDGSYKNIFTDFKFQDKLADDDRVFVSSIKEGVFLNSNQNYALVSHDGKLLYNKTLPDASGFSKRFKNRMALVTGVVGLVGVVKMASAEYAYQSGIYNGTITSNQVQQLSEKYKQGQKIADIGTAGASAYDFLNSFDKKASLSWQTYTTITRDGTSIVAVVIDKATGKEKKRVKINDTKPLIYVDDVTNTLYVITTLLDLKVYDLN